jgi:hypothetical protein
MSVAKIYGFSLMPEDDARLERLREAFGWTRSATIRELLKGATIESMAKVRVQLQESAGVQN